MPMVRLSELVTKAGVRSYYDRARDRILIEEKDKFAFFLPQISYAVIAGNFQQLAHAVERTESKRSVARPDFWLSASLVQSHLLPFIPPKHRSWVEESAQAQLFLLRPTTCALERPVKRVFIDPGHGGEDFGATIGGVREKDVVLKFAQAAAEELKAIDFEVMLSRKNDDEVPLDLRAQLAAEWKSDVFISVHANSYKGGRIRGPETYILSSEGTNAEARKLALLENTFVSHKLQKRDRGEEILDSILWDVGQTAYLQDSAHLAAALHTELYSEGSKLIEQKEKRKWVNRGVLQAPFLVLKQAAMPAVLLEIGYLSNEKDREWLKSKKFQQSLAKALAMGVKKYAQHCSGKK